MSTTLATLTKRSTNKRYNTSNLMWIVLCTLITLPILGITFTVALLWAIPASTMLASLCFTGAFFGLYSYYKNHKRINSIGFPLTAGESMVMAAITLACYLPFLTLETGTVSLLLKGIALPVLASAAVTFIHPPLKSMRAYYAKRNTIKPTELAQLFQELLVLGGYKLNLANPRMLVEVNRENKAFSNYTWTAAFEDQNLPGPWHPYDLSMITLSPLPISDFAHDPETGAFKFSFTLYGTNISAHKRMEILGEHL